MMGRRVKPDAEGWLSPLEPGDYGRATAPELADHPRLLWWQVCAPDGCQGSLSPEIHQILEHEDGTITVTPSLDMSKWRNGTGYHGFLKHGEWT